MPRLRAKLISLPLILFMAGAIIPSLPTHVHSGEELVPAEWRDDHPGPHVISVAVAIDEEWLQTFGPDAELQARRLVSTSAAHLRPAGISLRFAGLETWTSDDNAVSLHGFLDVPEITGGPVEADMVVGLTAGRYSSKVDGVSRPRQPYVVVRRHPGHPDRDAYVLTHEIGHVLGLDHHACPDGRCFMADHKYDLSEHWCPDHLELLTANGGFLHFARDAEL